MDTQVKHVVVPGGRRMMLVDGTYVIRSIPDQEAIALVQSATALLGVLDNKETHQELIELFGVDFFGSYSGVIARVNAGEAMIEYNPYAEEGKRFRLISRTA